MPILVDASALVAMITGEPEARSSIERLLAAEDRLCCAVGLWEATRAIARKHSTSLREAAQSVERFRAQFGLGVAAIGHREARLAIDAHDRDGKCTGHPAGLSMRDCFAYACARANGARLLYKGDDFATTDMAW